MARTVPFKGRHLDPALLPAGLRRRYILFLTALYSWLRHRIEAQVVHAVRGNPLGFIAPTSKMNHSGTGSMPANASTIGKALGKEVDLKEFSSAKRHSYEEGRQNVSHRPEVSQPSLEKHADEALQGLLAQKLAPPRAGRYSRARGKFLVLEDEVFSPLNEGAL